MTEATAEVKHNIPLPSIEDEINDLTVRREKATGKRKPEPKQELNLAKGEEQPEETAEAKATREAAEQKTVTDIATAKKHGGEKLDDKGNVVDTEGKIVKTAEEIKTAEVKPKKPKFWKKETVAPATNGEATKPKTETAPVSPETISLGKLPKEIQEKLKRADALEAIVNRPSVKLVLKAEESGKDFKTFYSEVSSKDPFKIPNVDVYKMQLNDVGGYTQAEIDRKVERFMEKDEDDQADIIAPFRKTLKDNYDKEQNDWTPKFEAQENPVETAWDTLVADIPKVIPQYAKELELEFGVPMTPEIIKNITNTSEPLVKIDKETGRIDTKDFLRASYIVRNIDAIAETIDNQARTETAEEFNERYNLPLSAETGNHLPQPRQESTAVKKRVDALMESLPK